MVEPSPPKPIGVLPVVSESVRTTSTMKRKEESQRVRNEPPPPPEPPDQNVAGKGNGDAVMKKRCKVRGSWSPPSTSRPPDAVTAAGERPNQQSLLLVRDGRCEGGGEGDMNVNKENCGKKEWTLVQIPPPLEWPATVADSRNRSGLGSLSFMKEEARDVQDEDGRVQWELRVTSQSVNSMGQDRESGRVPNQVGQAQNISDKCREGITTRNPLWLSSNPTRNQCEPDLNVQERYMLSSPIVVFDSSPRLQLPEQVKSLLPFANPLTLIREWVLMKPPWVSLVDMCQKESLAKQRIERVFTKWVLC